ncbi:hypothetical protein LguiB_004576 [Lonicera macranthoides]
MRIDLEQPSEEHQKDREENRSNMNANAEDHGGEVRNRDGATTSSLKIDEHKNLVPHDGMEFESKEDAFSFYKEYAKFVGFATIIKASRRSRISGKFIDAKFVCTRYGSKRETGTPENLEPVPNADSLPVKKKRGRINRSWSKTDCKACMHVKRIQDGRWVIHNFSKEHNHEIYPDHAYYFRGHRSIDLGNNNVDALHAIRARTKKMYVTLSKQSGRTKKAANQKSCIVNVSEKHLALSEGDSKAMLDHFMYMQDENPNFFYAIDLNLEQRLRNVFWVDAKGRLDCESFGDVVFFDTTYIKSEYKLPFVPFIGVNNHFQFLLLGCALIADESNSTFAWVMRAWRRAMGGKAPKVILTDQDKAFKEAIAGVFPESRHCFCLWHILSKVQDKLGYVTRRHENFLTKFNKCVLKSGTSEWFEKRWWKMVDRFDLSNDLWIQSLYGDRKRWVPTYMRDIFLAGMSTAQRSESMNSIFDKCLQRKSTLREFLDQYKAILQEKYEEEAKADFETWHKQPGLKSPSPFGKQMVTIYTHAIFKKFQVEVLGVVACHPKKDNEDGATELFKVQDFEENQDFIVLWNEITSDISCSCRLFEYNGFLCRHGLIVLQMSGIHDIPSQYILKRWTKDAKNRQTNRQVDLIESRIQRYNDLCRRAFKLGDEGSLYQESYNIAFNALEEALRKCENVNNSIQSMLEPSLPIQGLHDFEEVTTQGNCASKTNKMNSVSKKGRVQPEPELITIGMHEGWQQMEQLNSRVPTLGGYFGTQHIPGMEQLNAIGPSRDDYYGNQQSMQGLGQLNSIAPIHDGHYLAQQRLHGLAQLHFRPQTIQSCFDMQDSLQDMHQSNVGPTPLHGVASKHLQPKQLPQ